MNKEISSHGQRNLDWLTDLLKKRLQSNSKAKKIDSNGNVTYIDASVFGHETLEAFIQLSLSDFNQTPYFTFYTFDDSTIIDTFAEILVEGATLYALSSQALIERGREFTIGNNGLNIAPPSIADMLNTQYCTLLNHHWEKLKTIKSRITEFKK